MGIFIPKIMIFNSVSFYMGIFGPKKSGLSQKI